jgi:hypothetical protein
MDCRIRPCALAAMMFVTSLSAADTVERGFYFGASGGRVEHEARGEGGMLAGVVGPFPISGFLLSLRPGRVVVDDVQAGWSATLGYRINKYLAAELSYHDFGEASVTERYFPNFPPLPAEIVVRSDIDAFGPSLSVLGTLPVSVSFDLFARGGVLFVDQEIGNTQGTFRNEQSIGDEVLMAGVGAQWSFAPRWTARLEYQRTGSIDYDADIMNLAGTEKIEQFSLGVLFDL